MTHQTSWLGSTGECGVPQNQVGEHFAQRRLAHLRHLRHSGTLSQQTELTPGPGYYNLVLCENTGDPAHGNFSNVDGHAIVKSLDMLYMYMSTDF